MKYKVLYNTQINNEFKAKDEIIEFPKGTDGGYILSLIKNKVIEELKEDIKSAKANDEVEESESQYSKDSKNNQNASKSNKKGGK